MWLEGVAHLPHVARQAVEHAAEVRGHLVGVRVRVRVRVGVRVRVRVGVRVRVRVRVRVGVWAR